MLTGQVELKELLSISEIAAAAEMAHEAELRSRPTWCGPRAASDPTPDQFHSQRKSHCRSDDSGFALCGFLCGNQHKNLRNPLILLAYWRRVCLSNPCAKKFVPDPNSLILLYFLK